MTQPAGNRVLAGLAPAQLTQLMPHLRPVVLTHGQILETANERIESIYFPNQGFASVVGHGRRPLEIGLIGREGMTGLAVLLGQDRAFHTAHMRASGDGQQISVAKLRQVLSSNFTLHHALLGCVSAFYNQVAGTAVANACNKNEERLARCLLLAHDRIDGSELPLTHKLLAHMLGVQRPAVTLGLQRLERARLIRAGRGRIVILDRSGLVKFANGAYDARQKP